MTELRGRQSALWRAQQTLGYGAWTARTKSRDAYLDALAALVFLQHNYRGDDLDSDKRLRTVSDEVPSCEAVLELRQTQPCVRPRETE